MILIEDIALIYAYLQIFLELDSEFQGNKCGALLYPTVTNSSNVVYPLQGTPIIVKTINLNTDWENIHNDLLDFIRSIERVQDTIN